MYKFQHIVTDIRGKEVMEVNLTLPESGYVVGDLAENFRHFLLGCGFPPDSILAALEEECDKL